MTKDYLYYTNPKPADFIIAGELIKIECVLQSFFVYWQIPVTIEQQSSIIAIKVHCNVFPIKYLHQFFEANSKKEQPLVYRSNHVLEKADH